MTGIVSTVTAIACWFCNLPLPLPLNLHPQAKEAEEEEDCDVHRYAIVRATCPIDQKANW
jgi:hypothetical protein